MKTYSQPLLLGLLTSSILIFSPKSYAQSDYLSSDAVYRGNYVIAAFKVTTERVQYESTDSPLQIAYARCQQFFLQHDTCLYQNALQPPLNVDPSFPLQCAAGVSGYYEEMQQYEPYLQ